MTLTTFIVSFSCTFALGTISYILFFPHPSTFGLADRCTRENIRTMGLFFPSVERLEVEIGSCWKAVFFNLAKNLDWEWVLETLGDDFIVQPSIIHMKLFESHIDLFWCLFAIWI